MTLRGRRVVVTRARAQAPPLVRALEDLGATVIPLPTIEIVPSQDGQAIAAAIGGLERYDWILLTSVNSVDVLFDHLRKAAAVEAFYQRDIVAIGPATADALRAHGAEPKLVPDDFIAEGILAAIGDVSGKRILLPRARGARMTVVEGLVERGATVEEISLYNTITPETDADALVPLRDGVDVITFTSPSTVRGFMSIVPDTVRQGLNGACVACIGPVTARAAEESGFTVTVMADENTTEGLTRALLAHFETPNTS